jgi:hypothetical protein
MIKFEKVEEVEDVIEEGKPYLDKILGKMVHRLKSNIRCIYDPSFDNGNYTISDLLAEHVKVDKVLVCNRVLDYCPGFGSVGFDMLGLGVTNNVVFVDTDENPVLNCLETAKQNSVLFYTTGYSIDTIADLPDTEKYDIIVANMGGFEKNKEKYLDFFSNIYNYMTLYADIYLIEDEDNNRLKEGSPLVFLKNVYFIKSIKLGNTDKTIMHYKLCHTK